MSALITEVAEGIYEIKPEGRSIEQFPLCTVYLVVDEKPALIEAGLPKQALDITQAVEKLIKDLNKVAYILLTHAHPDHAGGAGLLAQRFSQAQVVAHPEAAKFLTDEARFARLKQGFKQVFGEDAEERFGEISRVPEERFEFIANRESIHLGKRELRAIHTPGHDQYHLCFLDTMSGGLFCGDALGGYYPELDTVIPALTLGTDFLQTPQRIEELLKFSPTILLFSHGCAIRESGKYLQMAANNLRTCTNIALEGLIAGNPKEAIASMILDALAETSEVPRAEFSGLMDFTLGGVDAFQYFFEKKKMI